ncbi:MAG TPA: Gfo/Idh/MocA family oxidoreductase [Pseudonocardiaceae bacterium]
MTVRVGIYGGNGHQIHGALAGHPRATLVATAAFDPDLVGADRSIRHYDSLADLLTDDRVDLVSLCSPRRADQAADAITCLRAGRAVYAEKPSALSEADLDQILATAEATGLPFHEMADTAFQQPFSAARLLLRDRVVGRVLQVHAQKSYPYHDNRPIDADVDGGLIRWAGIHAIRMIEHVVGERVEDIADARTTEVDVGGRPFTIAASLSFTLASGGLASAVVNYLNPPGSGSWGDDRLRVFGTYGLIDITAGNASRLVVGTADLGQLDTTGPVAGYFDHYVDALLDGAPMPMTIEEEIRPTRIAIRAHEMAVAIARRAS